jgi:polysaccharide deacetylase family protein (PEP-CTERM system associated)
MVKGREIPGALSVDVEEYFHATVFAGTIPRGEWESRRGRVGGPVQRLVDLFEEWEVRATFFFLGWVAERDPGLVRAVAAAGHEIGSHGYEHKLVNELGPAGFREDIRRTKLLLEEITGHAVRGYRAPTFSITPSTTWALEVLAEEGYAFDSSIFPIRHDRYGFPSFPRRPVRLWFGARPLVEFPLSTWRVLGLNIPVSGGGYLRHLPLWFTEWGLSAVRRSGLPVLLYVHPWEIDAGQPRVPLSWPSRVRHYRGIGATAERLRALVAGRLFRSVSEVIETTSVPDWSLPDSPRAGEPPPYGRNSEVKGRRPVS